MPGVRAASWNLTWEVGSPWAVTLRRLDLAAAVLPLTDACRLEFRSINAASTVAPLLTLIGVLDATDPAAVEVRLSASAAQTRALGAGGFQLVLYIGVPGSVDPIIWARGYLQARDRAGDQG